MDRKQTEQSTFYPLNDETLPKLGVDITNIKKANPNPKRSYAEIDKDK